MMATIFYSMAGEGRGHATRARALIEELRLQHQVFVFAPGEAYNLLAPRFTVDSQVRIQRIPGLHFRYRQDRLDWPATVGQAARYLWKAPRLIAALRRAIDREQPDLIITDFEPALPRAARRAGVPFLSIDHQHFLVVNDLSSLPGYLRRRAWMMAQVVRAYYTGQAETVVSSFYSPPLKAKYLGGKVTQVGVLLRPEILKVRPRRGEHLLVYLRKFATPKVLRALDQLRRPVRIYGLGERPRHGNLEFRKVSEAEFLDDLAQCAALISTAGNQLVGEALYLGKPVFAMPETNNFEQFINAHFLRESGAGDWAEFEQVTPRHLQQFLDRLDAYQARIRPDQVAGNSTTLEVVRAHLAARRPSETTTKQLATV